MPFYTRIRSLPEEARLRTVETLQRMRAQLDRDIPSKDADASLLMASWNIRDFDADNRWGNGERLPETFFYIAEILSRFDFVAVQEINGLGEWRQVMEILGSDWNYITSDVTDMSLGGNGERLLFLYDTRKVRFQNVAGEIVLPDRALITPNDAGDGPGRQFRRTPYIGAFRAQWFKFAICSVHLYYGDDSGPQLVERINEIRGVARYLSRLADKALGDDQRSMLLMGDFNIKHPEHETMKALLDNGFTVPEALRLRTNFKQDKYYDQIAFKTEPGKLEYLGAVGADGKPNAGVLDVFESAMRPEDFSAYAPFAAACSKGAGKTGAKLEKYYGDWKTFQLSDHFPLWARLEVNGGDEYLATLAAELGAVS